MTDDIIEAPLKEIKRVGATFGRQYKKTVLLWRPKVAPTKNSIAVGDT